MARHATPRNKKQATAPGWAWLLAGLAVGLFVAFLVYLQGQNEPTHKLTPIPTQNETGPAQPVRPSEPETEKPSPKRRFDFYTILPEMEIPVPEPDPPKPASTRTTPHNSPPSVRMEKKPVEPGSAYVLQLGSFRNRTDADRLKAKIAMLGFEPHIQTVNINGNNWYRVRVGPYSNSIRIAEVRHRLHETGFDAILLKLKE